MNMGRPRAFDLDTALERALMVFWRQGYEGASLADLTEAMGINPPSLYAAFGSKEGLFWRTLDRYMAQHQQFLQQAYAQPTAREVASYLLHGMAEMQTNKAHPPGCLLIQGALSCRDTAESIRQELVRRRRLGEVALCNRFEQAIRDGDLAADQNAASLARYVTTVAQGMAVKAASGASRRELTEIIDLALMTFPERHHSTKRAKAKSSPAATTRRRHTSAAKVAQLSRKRTGK
jgi:AcrR family transcriptional regulator